MKNSDEILAMLGKPADDPEIIGLLKQFKVRWAPELDIDDDDELEEDPDWYVWRPSSPMGIEFGFQDKAHLKALAVELRGQSPLVLTSVAFYGEHEGVQPYQGALPHSITLSDSRVQVRQKLSSLNVTPRSHRRDVWDTTNYRIIVEHVPEKDILDSLLFRLPLTPWPALEEPSLTLPSIKEIIGLFGKIWYAPEIQNIFFPLGLDTCGADIATHRYADLSRICGLELYFFRDPNRDAESPVKDKGALFSGIKFYSSRYQDARCWAGELPFDLSYNDAYPDCLKKIGREPDNLKDKPLSGFALWHFPVFTLHILYDNVDNQIFCVSLFQPGTWKEAN